MTMTTWTMGGRTFRSGRRAAVLWQAAAGVFVALLLAGTAIAFTRAGTGRGSADHSSASTASEPLQLDDNAVSGGAAAGGSAGSTSAPIGVPPLAPKIIRAADLRLRISGSFTTAVDRATSVAGSLGGFVTSSSTASLERGRSSAEL